MYYLIHAEQSAWGNISCLVGCPLWSLSSLEVNDYGVALSACLAVLNSQICIPCAQELPHPQHSRSSDFRGCSCQVPIISSISCAPESQKCSPASYLLLSLTETTLRGFSVGSLNPTSCMPLCLPLSPNWGKASSIYLSAADIWVILD